MTIFRSAAFAAVLLLLPQRADADEISDEEDVCRSADVGTACTAEGKAGTCQESTCSRIDYSGEKPKSVDRACRKCVVGDRAKTEAPPKPVPPVSADVPAKAAEPATVEPAATDVLAKTAEPPKAEPAAKVETPAKTEMKTETKTEAAPAKSGCAIDAGALSLATVPLGLVLIGLARRRASEL